jgi:DNA-binding beta-propeller fold protein YncE
MAESEDNLTYRFQEGWGRLPLWWQFNSCTDVAVDSQDRVYALDRGDHPVMVFDRNGDFISSWGEGLFKVPHSIYLDKDDFVWISDCKTHTVMKFTQGGQLLQTLGTKDFPAMTYYGMPFNQPTGVAVAPSGAIFVSDGYGNYKVQKFSPEGEFIKSWGGPGTGPGQFACLHYLDVDDQGRVYVCDRENHRIEVFDEDGAYLTEWPDLFMVAKVRIRKDIAYVVEQGRTPTTGRISILSLDGKLLGRWSNNEGPGEGHPNTGISHGLTVDSRGDIYVAELNPNMYSKYAGIWESYPPDSPNGRPRIGKFVRD